VIGRSEAQSVPRIKTSFVRFELINTLTITHGAFTKAVVEGRLGEADLLRKGVITVNMLNSYVTDRVKELTPGTRIRRPPFQKPSPIFRWH
jgi:hypothetical protein